MNKEKLKEKHGVFEALLRLKKKRFEELSEFQQDHMESINEADLDQSSMVENQTEQMMRETRMENNSLDHLKEEIDYLEDYRSFMDKEAIGPSTLVKTNIGNFVVSVPSKVFEVKGEKFMGVSTQSPIYEALEGKVEGDELEFNGQQIEIEAVM